MAPRRVYDASRGVVPVALDLETDGLGANAKLIQIAAHSMQFGSFSTYVQISKLDAKITELTGISLSDTATGLSPRSAICALFKFLNSVSTSSGLATSLLAYNGFDFDFPVLAKACASAKLSYHDMCERNGVAQELDVLLFARRFILPGILPHTASGQPIWKLTAVHTALFGKTFASSHNAVADTAATLRVAEAIVEKYNTPPLDGTHTASYVRMVARPPVKSRQAKRARSPPAAEDRMERVAEIAVGGISDFLIRLHNLH